VKKEHLWLIVGYVVGSFFGIGQLFGLFSGVTGKAGRSAS